MNSHNPRDIPAANPEHSRAHFPTTHWGVVIAAGTDASNALPALDDLCRAYWPPIYAECRRRGQSPSDAQDSTQGFFAHLLRRESFSAADRARGRFRTFLLVALDHFLTDQWRGKNAEKRGGGALVLSLDAEEGEACFQQPARGASAAEIFDRRWALTLMNRALDALRAEYAADGRSEMFDAVQPFLAVRDGDESQTSAAAKLGMAAETFTVAVHRFRKRFRACLRTQVESTVADPSEVADEMRHLFGV
jgi:RNA polymerase sigma-70 factor (ECF subfamily)